MSICCKYLKLGTHPKEVYLLLFCSVLVICENKNVSTKNEKRFRKFFTGKKKFYKKKKDRPKFVKNANNSLRCHKIILYRLCGRLKYFLFQDL